MEKIAQIIARPLFALGGAATGSIPCSMVAEAMLDSALNGQTGKLNNKQLQSASKQFSKNE